ncbi:MAG: hypothetical protein QXV08_07245 [Desulfurococcus sp.]|uniref:hypothetical protein n=1 Tax=Desulfurococcus sp. TaxID=51678 RepID=UPI00317EC9D7
MEGSVTWNTVNIVMRIPSSLCLLSVAITLIAIPAVIVSIGIEFYSWVPIGPVT